MAGFNFRVGGSNMGSGGSGGVAPRGGCSAISGVLIGLLMIPIGFYLAYYGEAKLIDHGRVFESVVMSEPDAARAMEGELVKFSGEPNGEFLTISEWQGQALYWHRKVEEYVEERGSEGDVSYSWKTTESTPQWVGNFDVGTVTVRPQGANPVGRRQVYSAYRNRFATGFSTGADQGSPEVGDQRMSIDVLEAAPVIVLGAMAGGRVEGGRSFVVSVQNEQATLETLKSEYRMAYWGIKAGSVFLIFFGIMAVFGPLTKLVGFVPFVGEGLSCAFSGIAFVVSVVAVTLITVFIKAFWFLVVIAMLAVAFMIYRGVTSPRRRPGAADDALIPPAVGMAAPGAPMAEPLPAAPFSDLPPAQEGAGIPTPVTEDHVSDTEAPSETQPEEQASGPKFCAQCGGKLDAGSRFCASCGTALGGR